MAETTLAIDIPSICPRCASSYLKPSGKDIICGHCGAFIYEDDVEPKQLDIKKCVKTGGRRLFIEVICCICMKSFKATDLGKNTKTVCSKSCESIKRERYQRARRNAKIGNRTRTCKKCGEVFKFGKTKTYCEECSATMNWSRKKVLTAYENPTKPKEIG